MISRYDPFREAMSLRRAMDQLFEQSFIHPGIMSGTSSQMVPMEHPDDPGPL
jgi:HSP20 family protein